MVEHRKVVVTRRGGQRAADGLHEQARHVERDEDEGVQARAHAREARAEGEAEVLEGEVDGDAEEGWGEDDGADLSLKGVLVPGVGAQGNAGGVAWGVG